MIEGDSVRTPGGEVGRVLKRTKHPLFEWPEHARYDLDREADVLVYTVLLDSGEVRQYSFRRLGSGEQPACVLSAGDVVLIHPFSASARTALIPV